jgi:hypothetical protein
MNNNIFFGFALADSMFSGDLIITRKNITTEAVKTLAEQGRLTPCLNPSHEATIAAMRSRFGIEVEIPQAPPRVELAAGDSVIVMGVRGLPRLTDRHEYTQDEVDGASFLFSQYAVSGTIEDINQMLFHSGSSCGIG